MPLRALRPDGTSLQSIDCSPEQWVKVKGEVSASRVGWRLPCCEAGVVAKTSSLGTPFFAHSRRGSCTYSPETRHHLRLKALAVAAARAHGWEAMTEVSGGSLGDSWTADVLARRGRAQVAVEIQWSGQTQEELLARQERYRRHGVRGLWLIQSPDFPVTQEVPAVCVREKEDEYFAMLPLHTGYRRATRAEDWAQKLTVAEVLDAAFDRRLHWGFSEMEPISYQVLGGPQACYRCKGTTVVVHEVRVEIGPESLSVSLSEFGESPHILEQLLPTPERAALGIGKIQSRYSQTAGESYLAAGCIHCDALQGEHYLGASINSQFILRHGVVRMDTEWKSMLEAAFPPRWRIVHPTLNSPR